MTATHPTEWTRTTAPQYLALLRILTEHGITSVPTRGLWSITEPYEVPLRSTRTRREMLADMPEPLRERRLAEAPVFNIDLDARDDAWLAVPLADETKTWSGMPFERWVNHYAHRIPDGYEVLVDGSITHGMRTLARVEPDRTADASSDAPF